MMGIVPGNHRTSTDLNPGFVPPHAPAHHGFHRFHGHRFHRDVPGHQEDQKSLPRVLAQPRQWWHR